MITHTERPLDEAERVHLTTKLASARIASRSTLWKSGLASAVPCGVFGWLTSLASDAPLTVIAAFWAVLWLVFTVWIGFPQRKLTRNEVRLLEEAIQTNRARETRLQSTRVVEFEEVEDEGACYAFDHNGDSAVFIVGQEFYEDIDFPNTDFSLVQILGEHGQPIRELLIKRGRKLQPERVVSAAIKRHLELPEHLAIVPGALDRIEAILRPAGD